MTDTSQLQLAKSERLAYLIGGLAAITFALLGEHEKTLTPLLLSLSGLFLVVGAVGGT